MKLSLQHAKEFSRILQKPELKPESLDNDGNFTFQFQGLESETTLKVDPGLVASLIQIENSVKRGASPEDHLAKAITQICKELKI